MISNKLAKARKTRKSPGSLGLKKFGPGKLWVEKVCAHNILIDFLAKLDHSKILFFSFLPSKGSNSATGPKKNLKMRSDVLS